MFKHYFEQLDNIQIYPIISLSVFFAFFIGLIWWVIKADKQYIADMEKMPLVDNETVHPKTKKK